MPTTVLRCNRREDSTAQSGDSILNNLWDANTITIDSGPKLAKSAVCKFTNVNSGHAMPNPNAVIMKATLSLPFKGGIGAGDFLIQGLLNNPTAGSGGIQQAHEPLVDFTGWRPYELSDTFVAVEDSGAADLATGTIWPVLAPNAVHWRENLSPGRHSSVAQRFTTTVGIATDAATVRADIVRSVGLAGSVAVIGCEIWSIVGGLPSALLYTSTSTPTIGSLNTTTGFHTAFAFAAGATLQPATQYAAVFTSDLVQDDVEFLAIMSDSANPSPSTDGKQLFYGTGRSMDEQIFPGRADPLFTAEGGIQYLLSNTTVMTVPIPPADPTVYTSDMTQMVKDMVADADYDPSKGFIAMQLQVMAPALPGNTSRTFYTDPAHGAGDALITLSWSGAPRSIRKRSRPEPPASRLRDIQSGHIMAGQYSGRDETLELEFKNETYVFEGVPKHINQEFKESASKGRYFAQNIRGKYPFKKLGRSR